MFQHLIGLAHQQCPCSDTAPQDFNVSASGLYITDLEPFGMLEGLEDCEQGSIWTLLSHARKDAINTFQTDMVALLSQRYQPVRKPWSGVLGQLGHSELLNTNKQFVGCRLYVGNVKSGVLKLKGLGTYFEKNGEIDVTIYNNLGEEVYKIEAANTKAGQLSMSPLNVSLPMHHDYTNALEYFFVYTYNPQNKALINKAHCGCGGFNPSYNHQKSYIASHHNGNRSWAQWVMMGSFEADTLTEFTNNTQRAPNRFNGLLLSCEMYCKSLELLAEGGDINFEAKPLAMAYAKAIQFKAAENMANKLLLSNNINRAVLINREQIAAERTNWRAQYLEITRYLTATIDISQNDCFECKTGIKMSVSGIFS